MPPKPSWTIFTAMRVYESWPSLASSLPAKAFTHRSQTRRRFRSWQWTSPTPIKWPKSARSTGKYSSEDENHGVLGFRTSSLHYPNIPSFQFRGPMKLYTFFRSSASYRVRIALNLKNLTYQQAAIHLRRGGGEQLKPEYRAINPQA